MNATPCPKCGYTRQINDTAPESECPRCGIIYAKYAQYMAQRAELAAQIESTPEAPSRDWKALASELLFKLPEMPSRQATLIYAALLGVFLAWGIRLIAYDHLEGDINNSFMHNINLPFHEFGHVLFRPFGTWLQFLGGSLFQCLLPLILCGVFLIKERKPFSASFCLWWAGENLLDVAPYIGDARSMSMALTGEWNEGVEELREFRHDWHNILEPIGLLNCDHRLSALAYGMGIFVMGLSWAWGGYWLWLNWQAAGERES